MKMMSPGNFLCLVLIYLYSPLSAQPVQWPISLCVGDVFRGRLIEQDTQILIANPGALDTLFVVHAIPPTYVYLNQIICPNELFQGQLWENDTVINRTYHTSITGCDSIVYYFLSVKTNESILISGDSLFCKGGKTILSTGFYPKYNWSNGAETRDIEVDSSGTYAITVTDADGCHLEASISVMVSDPHIGFELLPPPCPNISDGMIELTVVGALTPCQFQLNGVWSNQTGFFTGLAAGDFVASVTDSLGCVDTSYFTLTSPPELSVEASADQTLTLGESGFLNVDIVGNYTNILWTPDLGLSCFDCMSPTVIPGATTNYVISVKNANGCIASDTVLVTLDNRRAVYFPNVCRPETGIFFEVFTGKGVLEVESLQIFNRWGEQVYVATKVMPGDASLTWDGRIKGKISPSGVYIYVIDILFGDGVTEHFTGDITLIN